MQAQLQFLVVDDYPLARDALCEMVTAHPHWQVVNVAENGLEAIALASLLQPDVVLMDVAMPKMNGLEATYRIKSLFPDMYVVLFSAYADDGFRQGSVDAGADHFIQKEKLTAAVLKDIVSQLQKFD